MPADLPIACSLSAAELPARLATMTALGRDALLDVRMCDAGARLRFARNAEVRGRVDAVVAAESRCCAFLAMTVTEDAGAIALEIEAPDGAEPVLRDLVDAFARARTRPGAPSTGAGAS